MDIDDIPPDRIINTAREAGATAHELAQVTLTLAVDLEEAAFIAWSNLLPVEITEAGLYVLDPNWTATSLGGAIVITADDVILDLQGFELRSGELAIRSTGSGVTIRNGRVDAAFGGAISVSGVGTRIERVHADVGRGGAISLNGAGSVLTDSTVIVGETATAVTAGDDTIVRNNSIGSRFIALSASSGTTLVDNQVSCGRVDPCIVVDGSANTISRNTVKDLFDVRCPRNSRRL